MSTESIGSWKPQEQGLAQILEVLRNANSADNRIQLQVQQKLHEFTQIPDFINYLMFILTKMDSEPGSVRAVAGILLKNNIRSRHQWSPEVLTYIQESCLASLGDLQPLVRNTVTSLTTTIFTRTGIAGWPQLIPTLLQHLDSPDYNLAEGSLGALQKILEDSGSEFRHESLLQPNEYIVTKLISLSDSAHEKIRLNSLTCYNLLIQFHISAAFQYIKEFIEALSKRATDQVGEIRALVCRAFVHILDAAPEVLLPAIRGIADFMLFAAQDENTDVALDACEFWLAFAEHDELKDHLEGLIPSLIPILTKRMVYTDYDIAVLGGDEDDETVPDREQDIKPRHYKAKSHGMEHVEGEKDEQNQDDSDDDEDDDEIYAEWNLRKCAAATLDFIASNYGDSILEVLLPILKEQLFHSDWKVREAGVLALGAIAEGCMSGIEPHLPRLIPLLLQILHEPKPLVRSITCWTLGRYCSWGLGQDAKTYLEPLIKGLLDMVLDKNKRVQEAACSALATLEEEGGEALIPYLEPILVALNGAFAKYQSKNLLILYDAVGTLAESTGDALSNSTYVDIIMPPLIAKWQSLDDEDTGLFPLMECLSSVAVAFGQSFLPFSESVFRRCSRLIQKSLHEQELATKDPNSYDPPDKDFMIVALDLLSGMVQGVGNSMSQLIDTEPNFFKMLFMGLQDQVDEVRQSSFALVGDLAIGCFDKLKPQLPAIMPLIIEYSTPRDSISFSSCNNACWAAGEVSLRLGTEMTQYADPLLQRYIPLLNHPGLPRNLRENSAITLGRLGVHIPQIVAPHFQAFSESWCKTLRLTRDNSEKESAFIGICNIIKQNPQGIGGALPIFLEIAGHWHNPSNELVAKFREVIIGYKSLLGGDFAKLISSFPPNLQHVMVERYQLQ